jgi:hypothetical protein
MSPVVMMPVALPSATVNALLNPTPTSTALR